MARIAALLSALMSLAYLLSIPAVIVFLFFDWRISVAMIPIGIIAALLAKWFNGWKLRLLYGRETGATLNELDWASGRRLDP